MTLSIDLYLCTGRCHVTLHRAVFKLSKYNTVLALNVNLYWKLFYILCFLQRYFSDSTATSPDRIQEVKGQVDELKGIMVQNIGKI